MTASWNAQLRVKKLNTFFAPEQTTTGTTIGKDKKEEQEKDNLSVNVS